MHRFLGKTMIRTLAVALCTAGGAWADVTTVQTNNGDTMTYEYEGDKLRIDVGQQDSYMLLVDGTVYSVTRSDGEYMVVDVSQAMSMFGSALRDAAPGAADSRVESFEATGRKETIAGIEGEVYLVKYIDHEGKAQQGEMVLSEDPRTLGLRDAIFKFARSITKSLGEEVDPAQLQSRLLEKDMGVLRYGQDMTVTSIQRVDVDDARFVLPAEPMDLSGIGGILGGSGGLGGLFGSSNKTTGDEPAAQDTESAAESPVEELGKAFGKLFGN